MKITLSCLSMAFALICLNVASECNAADIETAGIWLFDEFNGQSG